jgi:hypothetical protein
VTISFSDILDQSVIRATTSWFDRLTMRSTGEHVLRRPSS